MTHIDVSPRQKLRSCEAVNSWWWSISQGYSTNVAARSWKTTVFFLSCRIFTSEQTLTGARDRNTEPRAVCLIFTVRFAVTQDSIEWHNTVQHLVSAKPMSALVLLIFQSVTFATLTPALHTVYGSCATKTERIGNPAGRVLVWAARNVAFWKQWRRHLLYGVFFPDWSRSYHVTLHRKETNCIRLYYQSWMQHRQGITMLSSLAAVVQLNNTVNKQFYDATTAYTLAGEYFLLDLAVEGSPGIKHPSIQNNHPFLLLFFWFISIFTTAVALKLIYLSNIGFQCHWVCLVRAGQSGFRPFFFLL